MIFKLLQKTDRLKSSTVVYVKMIVREELIYILRKNIFKKTFYILILNFEIIDVLKSRRTIVTRDELGNLTSRNPEIEPTTTFATFLAN